MVEEWVKGARFEAGLMDNLRAKTNKALTTTKQKSKDLSLKLAVEDRGRKSAEAGLKNAQVQDEVQHKKLHYTKIKLATANQ